MSKVIDAYTPCGTYLLCRPLIAAEKSKGGIYIPESARNPLNQAVVLKCGDALAPEDWPKGTEVMFTQHSESALKIDDEQFVLVTAENVVMKKLLDK